MVLPPRPPVYDTLLLLFAGVLGAIVLRTAAVALARVTRMPTGVALAVVVTVGIALSGAVIAWRGTAIADQSTQIAARLPQTLSGVTETLVDAHQEAAVA